MFLESCNKLPEGCKTLKKIVLQGLSYKDLSFATVLCILRLFHILSETPVFQYLK